MPKTASNPTDRPHRLTSALLVFTRGLVVMAAGLTMLGYFSEVHWTFDLANHLKLQYLAVLILCLVILGLHRHWIWAGLASLFLLVNGWSVLPYYSPAPTHTAERDQVISLLQSNVWGRGGRIACQNLADLIRQKSPHLLTLEEYSPACRKILTESGIEKQYPHARHIDGTRISLYSRVPLDAARIQYVQAGNGSSIIAEFTHNARPVTIVMAHVTRPMDQTSDQTQQQHFHEMAEIITQKAAAQQPVIVAGDLNTTPWSRVFRDFVGETGLVDTQRGFGIQPSWPATYHILPVRLLPPLVPIDHVLVSPEWTVHRRELGPRIGSDHLPVYVEMSLSPR